MKHAKKAADVVGADIVASNDRDTFIFHASDGAGVRTVSGFDPTQDRVMLDFDHTYTTL